MIFNFSPSRKPGPIDSSSEGTGGKLPRNSDINLSADYGLLEDESFDFGSTSKEPKKIMPSTNALRLEKAVLGFIKLAIFVKYAIVVYVPAQFVCGVLGLGVIGCRQIIEKASGETGKYFDDDKMDEWTTFTIAPSIWFRNLFKLYIEDFNKAYYNYGTSRDSSIQASIKVLEEEFSSVFEVNESARETKALQKIAVTVCKVGTAVSFFGFYSITQIASGILGIANGAACHLRGKNIQPGINIALAPTMVLVALFKSAYSGFEAEDRERSFYSPDDLHL